MTSAALELLLVAGVGFLLPLVPVFPLRLWVLIPLVASHVHPALVVLAAGIGTSLGTLPIYGIARGVRDTRTVDRWFQHGWARRLMAFLEGKMFLAILLFALLPLPDQLMSAASGLKRYPAWRVALAFCLGRLPYFIVLAYIGSTHREAVTNGVQRLLQAFGV